MICPHLELLVRVEVGVGVVQAHDHAHQHQVGGHVVQEGPAEHLARHRGLQRPAQRVLHISRLDLVRGHLPDFFYAQPVALLVATFAQLEALDQLLAAGSTTTLREECLATN